MTAAWGYTETPPLLWLDASDDSTLAIIGGGVAQWADKSGVGNHVGQEVSTMRPVRILGELNGRPIVRFESSTLVRAGGISNANALSVFAVSRLRQQMQTRYWIASEWISGAFPGSNEWVLAHGDDSVGPIPLTNIEIGATLHQQTAPSARLNVWTLVGCEHANDTLSLYVDGQSGGQKTAAGTKNQVAARTFRLASLDSGYESPIDLAEILVFDAPLSIQERQRMEGYLAHKWGIAAILPVDHPYKAVAPAVATSQLSGVARTDMGAAASRVLVIDRASGAVVADVAPDALGDWSAELPPGEYELVYHAEDYQPVCHGPYAITAD